MALLHGVALVEAFHSTERRLRVAFFGTMGSITLQPLRAVAESHDVVLFIRAGNPPFFLRRMLSRNPLELFLRRSHIPCTWMRTSHDTRLPDELRAARPDIICVSSFRWRLPQELIAVAPHGGVNLHSSLLPRHRGAVPLFQVFRCDDRETGVTVHRLTERLDGGDILGTDRWPLTRGTTAGELNETNAMRGASLLVEVLRQLERGEEHPMPQDETLATRAPVTARSGRNVDFDSWPAERVWHFLNGVFPYYREEIGAAYGAVLGWEPRDGCTPGSVERRDGELLLHCLDGIVRLKPSEERG